MKYKIRETTDVKGNTLSIWHTDCLGQELKIVRMYYQGIDFLLEKNWTYSQLDLVSNKHKAIWAENSDGEPMGCIIYEYHHYNRQGWIALSFTDEKFRGRYGIYGILHREFEKEIIKLGGTSIASITHKDNRSRLRAGAREGMEPQLLRLYKDLTPDLENVKKELSDESRKPWSAILKERWDQQ